MGLAERRKAAQWQKDRFPDWEAQIDRAASFDVSVEVAWDQLAEDEAYSRDVIRTRVRLERDPDLRVCA